jgi:putative flippase GtrA
MFRYLACGGFNTALSIFLSWFSLHFIVPKQLMVLGMPIHDYVLAFLISFCISFPVGFGFSKYIVFPESTLGGRIQMFRYFVLIMVCLLLNYVLIKFFIEICGFWPTPTYILTAVLVAIFSFISQRRFTFKVSRETLPLRTSLDAD